MPRSFNDNLQIIMRFDYTIGPDFSSHIRNIKVKLNFIASDMELHSEENKIITAVKNLHKLIETFEEKARKLPKRLVWIRNQAIALASPVIDREATPTELKKSEILVDKITYKRAEMESIQEITDFINDKVDDIDDESSPSIVISRLKECLKKTQEYNISKLKRAQQKFEKSKELNDFMYGKRHPKLAHLLSLDSAVPINDDKLYRLETPFGPVWVEKKQTSQDQSRMIYIVYLDRQRKALKYDEMCEKLDYKFDPKRTKNVTYINDAITGIINPIIIYINQPLTDIQNTLGTTGAQIPGPLFSRVKYKYNASKLLTSEQKEAAAFLCGVLLLSESHEFRNPTGGKFERKAMKNVLKLAKNGCTNPFASVFSNAKLRYIPAGTGKMKDVTLILKEKLTSRNAEELAKNYIKLKFKNLITKNREVFLEGPSDNLKAEFGGGSYIQVTNFSKHQMRKIIAFQGIVNGRHDALTTKFKDISDAVNFIGNIRRGTEIILESFPEGIKRMIGKEKGKINKLMNASL